MVSLNDGGRRAVVGGTHTNESTRISKPAQNQLPRMHQGRQRTQTLRTPTVLELEYLRVDDKTIGGIILSSPLQKVRRGPLRKSFGVKVNAVCMRAMISGPR